MSAATTRSLFLVCLLAMTAGPARAQAARPLTPEQALSGPHFRTDLPMALSPDGAWVAYVTQDLRRIGVAEAPLYYRATGISELVDYGCDIWIVNTNSGETRNLTGGQGTSWGPAWSRDASSLAFYSDRSGEARVWIWERASSRLRQAASAAVRVFNPRERPLWSDDGRFIVAKLLPEGMTPVDAQASMGRKPTRTVEGAQLMLYEAGPEFPADHEHSPNRNPVLTERSRIDIARISVQSGAVERIVKGVVVDAPLAISADGGSISYKATDWIPTFGSANYRVEVAFADGRSPVRALTNPVEVSWHPDGHRLSYVESGPSKTLRLVLQTPRAPTSFRSVDIAADGSGTGWAPLWTSESLAWIVAGDRIFAVDVERATSQEITLAGRRILEIAPGGTSVLVVTQDAQYQESIVRISPAGDVAPILSPGSHHASMPQTSADARTTIFAVESASEAPSIRVSTAGSNTARRLTRDPYADRMLSRSRLLDYPDARGRIQHAALLLPEGYTKGRRYPMVVWGYAGALDSRLLNRFGFFGEGWDNMHLFTTRGWAVLAPDIPSPGPDRMKDIVDEMLPAVDAAIAAGVADPDRLGVFGHSNGGYTCLALLAQTHRFKAGMVVSGWGDYFAEYGYMRPDGEMYASNFRTAMSGGTPWTNRDGYLANSPWFSLDRVETPLLVVHGANDRTIPVWQADAVVVGLTQLGQTVSYARFSNEGHAPSRWEWPNQVELVRRMLAWFEKYLR
jgi:dipeptidyl aminopeptidase/acylaminoacyl peptidase